MKLAAASSSPPLLPKLSVTISGKAWRALPIGADPHYRPDTEGMRRIRSYAKVRRTGFGESVTLYATARDLAEYGRALQDMAYVDCEAADTAEAKREGRACRAAATRIFEAVWAWERRSQQGIASNP